MDSGSGRTLDGSESRRAEGDRDMRRIGGLECWPVLVHLRFGNEFRGRRSGLPSVRFLSLWFSRVEVELN